MNLEFANIPKYEPKKIDLPEASFVSYKPDFKIIRSAWAEFGAFKNILIIGHGGSVTSFLGMHAAFGSDKRVEVLSTTDPECIAYFRENLVKHDTLVIAVSKSGETVTQIEALMHFLDYPLLFITSKGSTLDEIGKKQRAKIFEHPAIGGRYTAFTEVALIPAAICGLDVEGMYAGAKEFYELYEKDNLALQAAQPFYALEQQGYVDVFMPIYSHGLFMLSKLIVQLCHESFGKAGLGQTYFAHEAPESQHHTNQRFFGGRKNVAGFFIALDNFRKDAQTIVPTSMHSIRIKTGELFDLHNIPLSYSMQSEFKGTWEDAKINNIPEAALHLNVISPKEIGSCIAFWQLFAVYSSVLRGVNAFDQPQIENSKMISWNKRKDFKA